MKTFHTKRLLLLAALICCTMSTFAQQRMLGGDISLLPQYEKQALHTKTTRERRQMPSSSSRKRDGTPCVSDSS